MGLELTCPFFLGHPVYKNQNILGFQKATWINKFFPESSVLIVVGILIGLFFFFVREDDALPKTLTPDIFFLFLLPPIIGEAGYFMPNRFVIKVDGLFYCDTVW